MTTTAYAVLDWDDKDPAEVINYAVDFVDALDVGDSLATAAFTFITQAGLTKGTAVIQGTKARVVISGGTDGLTGRLLCTVTTAGAETIKQVVRVKVKVKV